jgi:hypothetical protein
MELPGAMWVALIVVLTKWIETWKVGGRWAGWIVLALGVIAKGLQILLGYPEMQIQGVNWGRIGMSLLFGG